MRRCSSLQALSLPRPRALPDAPITALAIAFNCRFPVQAMQRRKPLAKKELAAPAAGRF
jgi:hypothetical protein